MALERINQRYLNCMSWELHLLLLIMLTSSFRIVAANNFTSDYRALMAFKASTDVAHKLGNWSGENPCSGRWFGVTCRHARVTRLVLEGLELSGTISSLMPLDQLRILSLENNALNGTVPNLTSWRYLRLLYLSENEFTGTIPDSVSALFRLWRLDLSNNKLSGNIPSSLNLLSKLLTLRLQNNRLSGMIPNLELANLRDFNVSGNELTGQIPDLLSNFSISSFQGNNNLCGTPLLICDASEPSKPDESSPMVVSSTPISKPAATSPNVRKVSSKLGIGAVIGIVVGDVAVVVLITFCLVLYYWRKYTEPAASKRSRKMLDSEKLVFSSANYPLQKSEADGGKLIFVDGRKPFALEDLLRASAEMIGKGTFGTTYKAVLEDGSAVAVKRLKDVNSTGRRDFEQHMEFVGRLRHPHLVFLRAYYYAKEEKLLVYDYLPSGNLFSLLHGNRGPGRTPLDWTTRLKITLGAARGLAYIHHQCKAQKLPHGNVKSCNVLIDKNGNACLSDFGLVLMASPSVVASRVIGYRAPEHIETKKISQRADVYSFGVLLLEILTGRPPAQSLSRGEEGIDLPKWVQSVVQEEWTAEVFDLELLRYKNVEEEMVAMLQIAMSCVSQFPENRPKMNQVVKMIEDIIGDQSPSRADSFDSPSLSSSFSEDTGTSH